jgi:hypothetical protein
MREQKFNNTRDGREMVAAYFKVVPDHFPESTITIITGHYQVRS